MRAKVSRSRWLKLVALFGVLGGVACLVFPHRARTIPLVVARFNPPPSYQLWAQDAIDCARILKQRDSLLAYTVVHDSVDVRLFTWLLVATEQPNGGFPCNIGLCAGRFVLPDTIMISSQLITRRWVIAHEVLHWAVDNAHELEREHGLPWGVCEFVQ